MFEEAEVEERNAPVIESAKLSLRGASRSSSTTLLIALKDAAARLASEAPPARMARAVASRAAIPAAVPVMAAARRSREPRISSSPKRHSCPR
jgi:hypothetical protein